MEPVNAQHREATVLQDECTLYHPQAHLEHIRGTVRE